MSFAVMSFYKYISKRLYDQSFILYNKQYGNVLRCEHLPHPPPLVTLSSAMPNVRKNV